MAAFNPEEWSSVHRHPDGTAIEIERIAREDDLARDVLLTKVVAANMPAGRVAELLGGAYAEAQDLSFFAKALGGSICVVPPDAEAALQGPRFFGAGQLKLKVQLYYLSGGHTPQFELLQSWM